MQYFKNWIMLSLYKPTTQILEFYYVYMSNGLTFEIRI